MKVFVYLLILLLGSLLATLPFAGASSCNGKILVVLAFDGFRWNYLEDKRLVNFRKLRKNGVSAQQGMQSSYPSETYPNFMTLVTGLHPESHGIIANNMFDPTFNEIFYYNTTDPKWFSDFEPIWMTNELNSEACKNRVNSSYGSAVFQWPGSHVMYKGRFPRFFEKKHTKEKPAEKRFNQVIAYLKRKNPPRLIMSYFEEPDEVGHIYGPGSQNLTSLLIYYDKLLGFFLYRLKADGILTKINIIVVADHGMTPAIPNGGLYLYKTLNSSSYFAPELGSLATVWPKKGLVDLVYNKLSKLKHLTVYYKKDIPDRLHYKSHRRIPPILGIPEKGWWLAQHPKNTPLRGCHGYDNNIVDMNAVFIASGPDFKKDLVIPTFSNIHLYPLFCHLLGVKPEANNGTLEALKSILVSQRNNTVYTKPQSFPLLLSLGVIIILVLFIIFGMIMYRKRKYAYRYDRVSSSTLSVLESFTRDIEDDMP